MGYYTKIYVAPASALKAIANGNSKGHLSSEGSLEPVSFSALVRLQALFDGVVGWDEAYDKVAIEMENEDYAESETADGGWSRVLPNRFCLGAASMSEAKLVAILPNWMLPENHAGQVFSRDQSISFLRELGRLATEALRSKQSLVFFTSE